MKPSRLKGRTMTSWTMKKTNSLAPELKRRMNLKKKKSKTKRTRALTSKFFQQNSKTQWDHP